MQFLLVNIICRRTSYVFENAERVFARVHSFNHFQIAENIQIEHQVIFFEFQVNLCAFFFWHPASAEHAEPAKKSTSWGDGVCFREVFV